MITTAKRDALAREFARAINHHGVDSDLNTSDFEIASILVAVVSALPIRQIQTPTIALPDDPAA